MVTKTAGGWHAAAALENSDAVTNDSFGESVAISGSRIVVGAPLIQSGAGRAYVFTKRATGWTQVAELKGSDTVADDFFGLWVAISGTTAVVGGAPERAYVFEA